MLDLPYMSSMAYTRHDVPNLYLTASRGRYVTVNADAGRALFYVLAESERSPADDPLVLWLNGVSGRFQICMICDAEQPHSCGRASLQPFSC